MDTKDRKFILLTFDLEEFDIPCDYDVDISLSEQLQTGFQGLLNIVDLLDKYPEVKATFFTTALFAKSYPEIVRKLSVKHEIASHTYSNKFINNGDLLLSKRILERIIAKPVPGIRMPQMQQVDVADLKRAGYTFDSSVNPTWIPGRYNHFDKPDSVYEEDGLLRIPASVSGIFRIPLFWLVFKNIPLFFYTWLSKSPLKKYGYLNLYFHPWEFADISDIKVPFYIKRGSKRILLKKLDYLLRHFTSKAEFITMNEFYLLHKGKDLQNCSNIASHL